MINYQEINKHVLNSLIVLFNQDEKLGSRDWGVLSLIDDRVKYVTVSLIDIKTSMLIPIKLDRFNKLYLEPEVIRGVVTKLLALHFSTIEKQPVRPFNISNPTIRAAGKKPEYETSIPLDKGGKIHLFSWTKAIII